MIHQLICERQNCDRAVVATTLRTVRYGNSSEAACIPIYTAVTAYYVVSRELASALTKTDLFYSSDTKQENQISLILQDKVPDIIRRREQVGRARELMPSPKELENDLYAIFGKYGGPMLVYRFICDEAAGGIMSDRDGVRQVMRGVWSGKGLPAAKAPTPREVANSVPAEGAGKLDFGLPSDADPEKCMVFDEPVGSRQPSIASDVLVAVCAAFPEIAKQTTVNVFDGVDGKMRLVILVKGGVPDDVKLRLSNFLAEYGCFDPEETFSADGDWVGVFDFRSEHDSHAICESSNDPVSVVVRVLGESDKECWLGSSRKMQDLSTFDGGEVVRAFAVGNYSKGMDSARVAKCLQEGAEIVLNGDAFSVKRVSRSDGRIVVESRRVVQPGQAVCDFPAELVERLAGPCGLPRRDEEMFRSWVGRIGGFRSYEILGESRWCDEPAFGEPCDCVKVLLRLNESLGVFSYSKMWKDFKDLFAQKDGNFEVVCFVGHELCDIASISKVSEGFNMKLSHSSFRAFDGISGIEFIDELCLNDLNDLNASAITNISADLYGKTYSLAGYHIATGLYGKKMFVFDF